jgi:hypothetical protein
MLAKIRDKAFISMVDATAFSTSGWYECKIAKNS